MHRRRTGSADSHHEGGVPVTGSRWCASGAHRPAVGTTRIVPVARTGAIEETTLRRCEKALRRCHAGDVGQFSGVSPNTSGSGATAGPRASPGRRRLRVPARGWVAASAGRSRVFPANTINLGRLACRRTSRPAFADSGRPVVHEALIAIAGVAGLTRGLLAALALELRGVAIEAPGRDRVHAVDAAAVGDRAELLRRGVRPRALRPRRPSVLSADLREGRGRIGARR